MAKKLPLKHRIRTKLIINYVIPVVIIELIFAFFVYVLARESLDNEMGRRLSAIAQATASQIRTESFITLKPGDEQSHNYQILREKLAVLSEALEVQRIYIFDKEHRNLADSTGLMSIGARYYKLTSDRHEIQKALEGQAVSSTLFEGPDGNLYKSGYAPLRYQNNVVAILGADASADFFSSLRGISRNLLLLAAVTVAGIVIISLIFSRRIERPLTSLVQSARQITEGNLHEPIEQHSDDELGFLAKTMEDMRQSIVENTSNLMMLQRGIAHEVRNPLGGMELFADLLLDELDDESHKDHVRKIRKEIHSLNRVADSFLDYTRELRPDLRDVEVDPFLQQAAALVASEVFDNNIKFSIQTQQEPKLIARMDADLMQSVMINVLKNACQAMGKSGSLTILATSDGHLVKIEITDTGPGITTENLESIFKPFFTTKEQGSGLGLAFAKKICELHEGDIVASSKPGQGTSFIITIPLTTEG